MKKFFALALVALALVACDKKGNEPEPVEKVALETPVLTVSNQTEDGFTISWNAVENAVGYTYIMTEQATTTETSVTFSDLQPGSYTVRVQANAAADSKEYKDSQFADITVTITAPVPDVWFTQEVFLSDEYASEGYTKANSVWFTWQGIDVISVEYAMFEAAQVADYSNEEVYELVDFYALESEFLAEVNGEGIISFFEGCDPNTEYALIAFATHVSGEMVNVRGTVTTETVEANPAREQWLGDWTLTASESLIWDVENEQPVATFQAKDWELDVTIVADETNGDQVLVYGWTRTGMDLPALGVIGENGELQLVNQVQLDQADADGYAPYWMTYCAYNNNSANTFVTGQFAAYTFTLDGNVAEGLPYEGELSNGYDFQVRSFEVYAFSGQYINWYTESFPVEYIAGDVTFTKKADAAPKAMRFGAKAKAEIASRASVASSEVVAF